MVPARPLTVLQMLPALDAGGVEQGTLEVGRHLVDHGHRSLVMSAGGRLLPRLQAEGSTHFAWDIGRKSPWTLRLVPRLRRLLATERVDILHLRSRLPAWVGYLAWRGMDPATRPHLVTTVHGPYTVNAYSAIMTHGERVIAVSEMIRTYILDNYPAVPPERIRVIPRGVDPMLYPHGHQPAPAWRDDWYLAFPETRGKALLTLPARLTRWKGQEDFIDLVAALRRTHPEAHGLIVGEPHPRRREFLAELRQRVHARGLDGHITFTGHRADIREIMALSAIVLSLSRVPEAFGRATLEALSLGRPVIAYDHGGVAEQLAALLPAGGIAVGDWQAGAAKAGAWLEQPPAVPKDNPFTLERMLAATLATYAELAAASRPYL